MPPLNKLSRQFHRDPDVDETPSNNLWVGNLTNDVTDADLMNLFAKYGALDSVTSYSSRSYAFIFFKHMEDAQAAKDALQGAIFRGNSIKIEFARPAKACRNLWVGGISPAVSKEQLEEEFAKFGKIDDFKFLRDRNTAFIEYVRLEDASLAMRNMNAKRIGGDQIRVDFLRSQPSRRDQWPESRDGQLQGRSVGMGDFQPGYNRPLHTQSSELRRDGPPSKVLWIGYPPSVQIDEQMLHNAMILFGEIERIKSFHSRHYAFVEFRSVDEARRAKEGLQGRLFNDPRITIMFSSSDLPPGNDHPGFYTGGETRPEMFFNEHQFRPQIDVLGHGHPMVQNKFPGPLPSSGILGPNVSMRPFGPQGGFEPLIPGPEFNDLATSRSFQDVNSKNMMGPNWRRQSPPTHGILSSPATGIRPPVRPALNQWDVLDINQFQRDSKRLRIDGPTSVDDASFPARKVDDRGVGFDQQYGIGPVIDGNAPVSYVNAPGKTHINPVGARTTVSGAGQSHPDNDFIWRGIIAKGGTPVCHARCVPIGEGIGSELPEVVNCSARTGMDQLTKHYAEAVGFDIVFFLPDSEDDFASYTEFLRYLGAKNRAGVAKFDDGTTLFLVPPSEFLRKVLKVTGPERLYGLVLKFPQVSINEPTQQHQQSYLPTPTSDYGERQQVFSSHAEYGLVPSKQERLPPMDYTRVQHSKQEQLPTMDYNRIQHEETKEPIKSHFMPTSEPQAVQPLPQEYANNNGSTISQAGVSLTPELIATLASLLPGRAQSSGLESAKQPPVPSRPPIPPVVSNKGTTSEGWMIDHQSSDLTGQSFQQMGSHFNPQGQNHSQFQPYPPLPHTHNQYAPQVMGTTQVQDAAVNLPQQVPIPYRPLTSYSAPSESAHATGLPLVNPQYPHDLSQISQRGYGPVNGVDTSVYGSSPMLQSSNTLTSSNQGQGSIPQSQPVTQIASDKVNPEPPNQMQHLPSAILGTGNGASDVEVDKDQRYKSTLQFAANLLLQIQQQQQQGGRGSGNQ